ncbi:MAG TPA: hypothetical protein VD932_05395 [Aquabacterium sp.]|nr:hypothetical protein [Aquabacterium sp.]
MKRGLTYLEAIDYVGVKRRTFDSQWRPHLVAISQGTCLIFDREDLDRLFNEFKQNAGREVAASPAGGHHAPAALVPAANLTELPSAAVSSLADRRPTSEKGVGRWVVKTASTKTQRAGGGSTSSTAVNAFKAVSDRIRKPKLG